MARRLQSISEKKKIDWKAVWGAFQFIPRFLYEIKDASPLYFYTNAFCRIISALTPVAILYVGKLLVDEIILQTQATEVDYYNIIVYAVVELGLVFTTDVLSRLINLTDGLQGDLYSNASSIRIIKKTQELEIAHLEDPEFYDKLERARIQTNNRVGLMSTILSQVQNLIMIVSLIIGLVYFEPWLILILFLSIVPSFLNELKFSSSRYSLARSWTAERRELDYLRYIGANDKTAKEMKLFGLIEFVADRFKRLSDEYFLVNKKLAVQRTWLGTLFNLLGTLCYYGAYGLIIVRTVSGFLTVGELTFLSGSFNRLRNSLQNLFNQFTRISESALYLKDYFDYLDIKVSAVPADALPVPDKLEIGFEFKDVHFTYPGSENPVLNGVSFKINAREKMAFVGQNGAGKTTLIKLLLRFYEPDAGEIMLEGKNINLYNIDEYQKFFGVIFQDFIKYEFKVRENIGVGDINRIDDIAAIEMAAERSLADEVVNILNDGYDQQLGKRFSRGQDLSGGQWQKIALARAYMKDADVMILDEPTSALDARAEYEAFQRFIGLTQGKTSIIISHRFSTVRMADRIMVLEDGKVSELGTHEELMEHDRLYAELFSLQAAGYN